MPNGADKTGSVPAGGEWGEQPGTEGAAREEKATTAPVTRMSPCLSPSVLPMGCTEGASLSLLGLTDTGCSSSLHGTSVPPGERALPGSWAAPGGPAGGTLQGPGQIELLSPGGLRPTTAQDRALASGWLCEPLPSALLLLGVPRQGFWGSKWRMKSC